LRGTALERTLVAMRTALAALLLCASTPALADKWTGTDTALEIATVSLFALDYIQTTEIVVDGMEGNGIMGSLGDRVPPSLYFGAVSAVHIALVAVLPQPYRRIAQGVTIGVQTDAIYTNWQAGYGFAF
jgi:NAD(P)H-hydrate repair Nnr-like enzyme with NAD(P)H-hydrate epimerase domain